MFISYVYPSSFPSSLIFFFSSLFIIYILLCVICLLLTEYGLNFVISLGCIVYVHCMCQYILSSQWVVLFFYIVCVNIFCHLNGLYCLCPLYVSIYFVISMGCIVFVHCMCQYILSSQWGVLFFYIVCVNVFCHLSGLYCFCPLYVSIYFVISMGCIVFVHCMCQYILSSQWVVLFFYTVCVNVFCHLNGLYCFCPLYVSIYFVISVGCIVFDIDTHIYLFGHDNFKCIFSSHNSSYTYQHTFKNID